MSLSLEVKNYISNYKNNIEKDLLYIDKYNWSTMENVYKRIKSEKKQRLLTERALTKLKYFAKISEEYRHYTTVKEFLELLLEVINTYIDRQVTTDSFHDWTKYEEDFKHLPEKELEEKVDVEIQFQSEILDVVNRLRLGVKSLNLDDSESSLNIDIFADIPPPFLLRNKMESLFPEIIPYMKNKHEQETKK